MPPQVKICGITRIDALQAAADAGATYTGLVFHPASPRYLDHTAARALTAQKPATVKCVGLFVDPDFEMLDSALAHASLDMLQLHGSESPEYIRDIRTHTSLPVMKAVPVANVDDLANIAAYAGVCDWLLFDTKPPYDSNNPGGRGRSFDWNLLKNIAPGCPWMLAGGLNADNVGDALGIVLPDAVDVSSGVEAERGVKDRLKIRQFVNAVVNSET